MNTMDTKQSDTNDQINKDLEGKRVMEFRKRENNEFEKTSL